MCVRHACGSWQGCQRRKGPLTSASLTGRALPAAIAGITNWNALEHARRMLADGRPGSTAQQAERGAAAAAARTKRQA